MNKIDKRKKYVLVIDVETANTIIDSKFNDGLVYDIGFGVYDKKGVEYVAKSWVIEEIFNKEKELMQSAYYAHKLPKYYEELENGTRTTMTIKNAQKYIKKVMETYNITEVYAYNAKFDKTTLDNTIRYVTKSKSRYFFPYGTEIKDIWNMACCVLCTQKTFLKQNIRNDKGNFITNAERVFGYISCQNDFEEEHIGLHDVRIEAQILARCFAQHKHMETNPYHANWRLPGKAYNELVA